MSRIRESRPNEVVVVVVVVVVGDLIRFPMKAEPRWTLPALLEEAGNGPMLLMLGILSYLFAASCFAIEFVHCC